jgi:PAS domain S-box-containing protein
MLDLDSDLEEIMDIQLVGGVLGLPLDEFSGLIVRLQKVQISLEIIPLDGQQPDQAQKLSFVILSPEASTTSTIFLGGLDGVPRIFFNPDSSTVVLSDLSDCQVTDMQDLYHLIRGMAMAKISQKEEDHLRLLAEIVETSPNIISYSDSDFKIRYLNKTGLDRFGYKSIQEIAGESAFIVRSDDPDDPELKLLLKYLHKYGVWRGEKILLDSDMSRFPADLIIKFHRNPHGSDFYSLIARDVTQQKNSDSRIVELQNLYVSLADASQELIILMSDHGQVLYANNTFRQQFPEVSRDLANMNIFTTTAKYTPQIYQAILRGFETKKTDFVEDRVQLPDQNYWLRTWLLPIPDQANEIHSLLLISRDISTEKENALSIIKALESEREYNELQSRFVSMISHEFKTPLSTILSSIELLRNYHEQLHPEKKEMLASRIEDSVRVMNRLLEDILLIGRIKDQQARVMPEKVDPVKLCSDLMENVLWNDQFGHPIKLVVSGVTQPVLIDPEILRHILDNILNNAIKYSPSGSKIIFNLISTESQLSFEIIDEGIGMSPDTLEHIYEPFFRGRDISGVPGTGLGMTIVRKAVELLQGVIEVQSDVSKGTRVLISIPVEIGSEKNDQNPRN